MQKSQYNLSWSKSTPKLQPIQWYGQRKWRFLPDDMKDVESFKKRFRLSLHIMQRIFAKGRRSNKANAAKDIYIFCFLNRLD